MLSAVSERIGERDVVLKTHQALHPDVAEQIDAGLLLASASIRDPREIALAMVDHGRRARRFGFSEFSECRTVYDALPSIDNQVANLKGWSTLKKLELFSYNGICFDTMAVVARLAAQIGVVADPVKVMAPFQSKETDRPFQQRRRDAVPGDACRSSRRYSSNATPNSTASFDSTLPPPRRLSKRRSCDRRDLVVNSAGTLPTFGAGYGLIPRFRSSSCKS